LSSPQDTSKEFQLEDKNILVQNSPKPRTNSAWLGFIEAKNIEAIDWQILTSETGLSIQVQLQETKGKPTQFQITFCRQIKQATKQNQLNEPQDQLEVNNNKVKVKMHSYEVLPIRIDF
jgi:UTP:GlnB (protein PII) uridylyltransferase